MKTIVEISRHPRQVTEQLMDIAETPFIRCPRRKRKGAHPLTAWCSAWEKPSLA